MQLQSALSAAEVDRNVAQAAKLDLTHDVNRLSRMLTDRDEQLQRLARQLETKDQTVAAMRPLLKESQRASGEAKAQIKTAASTRNWKY